MLLKAQTLSFLPFSAKTLDLSSSAPPSRRCRKSKNFPNLIRYFSFVAGDFMAYRYNVHGSNPALSMVTVDDDEYEDPSIPLFSNTFPYFIFIIQGPLKSTIS